MKNFKWWLVGFLSLCFWLTSLYSPNMVRAEEEPPPPACFCNWSRCTLVSWGCSGSFYFRGWEYPLSCESDECMKRLIGGSLVRTTCSACGIHGYGGAGGDYFSLCVDSCPGAPSNGGVECGGCSAGQCQGNSPGSVCGGGTGICRRTGETCPGAAAKPQCGCVQACVEGVPGVPTLHPGDGESVKVVSSLVTVGWDIASVATVTSGELELYPASLRGTDDPCEDDRAHCNDNVLASSFTFSYEPVEYYYRVRAINDCGGDNPRYEGEWAEATFTIVGPIAGRVFWDGNNNAQMSGGRCALIGAPPMRPGEGSQVVVDGSYSSPVGGGRWDLGLYGVENVPVGPLPVVLEPGDSQANCTCPENCRYIISAPIPQPIWTGLYFFVTYQDIGIGEAWFQGVGGNFHADGGNLTVNIPSSSSCSGSCEPYLITEDAEGTTGMVSYSDDLDLGDGEISEDGNNWHAQTSYQGLETGYNYFARILEDDPDGIEEWIGGKPDDGTIGVFKGDGVSRINGGVPWTIDDGTVVVLLVPNDLLIDVNIDVEEGGFLAIISSGDITIGDEVTNVEGVYIADGAINTCESSECGNISGGETVVDRQLVLEGIFTGWGGVGLRRDFGTEDNNTNPAELFIYRPDLQTNAYKYLLWPHYTWKEQKV